MEISENKNNDLESNVNLCVICQDSLNSSDNSTPITTLRCRHQFHTHCILECALRGRIACSICRVLPITNYDQEQIENNLDQDYHYHNTQQLQNFF